MTEYALDRIMDEAYWYEISLALHEANTPEEVAKVQKRCKHKFKEENDLVRCTVCDFTMEYEEYLQVEIDSIPF